MVVVEEGMIEPATEPTLHATPSPTAEPDTEPTPQPTPPSTPAPMAELDTGPTPEEPTTGMKRPRRAAAVTAMEKMQEVLQWEHCKESSHMFKRVAQQINEEFERVSKGERSYIKKSSTVSTGDGGAAVPDPPSDDELKETKDNDEVEADSVDGSSDEEGSFVVSDNHLSQGETGDEHTGSEGDKSSLTCTDNSDEEEVTGLVDDTASVASANESMPPTQPMAEYLAEQGLEETMETLVDQGRETIETQVYLGLEKTQMDPVFDETQAEPPVFGDSI